MSLALDRLSSDWQARYAHPVLVVETFVDPEQFLGTACTAQGWEEQGLTDRYGRRRGNFYVTQDRTNKLLVRELSR